MICDPEPGRTAHQTWHYRDLVRQRRMSRRLFGFAAVILTSSLAGCGAEDARRTPDFATREVAILAPWNYLGGAYWAVGLPGADDQLKRLRQPFAFRCGDYTPQALCKEIIRATGLRVEWLPEDAARLGNIKTAGLITLGDLDSGGTRRVPLGTVLGRLVSRCTETTLFYSENQKKGLWTAWMAEDAIYLVLLPGGDAKADADRPRETDPVESGEREGKEGARWGFREAHIVVAKNPEYYLPPWRLDVPPPEEQRALLEEEITLAPGRYTVVEMLNEIGREANCKVRAYPDLQSVAAGNGSGDSLAQRKVFGVGGVGKGLRLDRQLPLGRALQTVVDLMTEVGLGKCKPDRMVWVALVAEEEIVLLMLPH